MILVTGGLGMIGAHTARRSSISDCSSTSCPDGRPAPETIRTSISLGSPRTPASLRRPRGRGGLRHLASEEPPLTE